MSRLLALWKLSQYLIQIDSFCILCASCRRTMCLVWFNEYLIYLTTVWLHKATMILSSRDICLLPLPGVEMIKVILSLISFQIMPNILLLYCFLGNLTNKSKSDSTETIEPENTHVLHNAIQKPFYYYFV
jgi:hypothetical protein